MRRSLIVDDNRAFAENLAEIFADAGATVDLADDGLISDMRMPEMGGTELVHRLHAFDPGLPAVVVTAYTNDDPLRRRTSISARSKPSRARASASAHDSACRTAYPSPRSWRRSGRSRGPTTSTGARPTWARFLGHAGPSSSTARAGLTQGA